MVFDQVYNFPSCYPVVKVIHLRFSRMQFQMELHPGETEMNYFHKGKDSKLLFDLIQLRFSSEHAKFMAALVAVKFNRSKRRDSLCFFPL